MPQRAVLSFSKVFTKKTLREIYFGSLSVSCFFAPYSLTYIDCLQCSTPAAKIGTPPLQHGHRRLVKSQYALLHSSSVTRSHSLYFRVMDLLKTTLRHYAKDTKPSSPGIQVDRSRHSADTGSPNRSRNPQRTRPSPYHLDRHLHKGNQSVNADLTHKGKQPANADLARDSIIEYFDAPIKETNDPVAEWHLIKHTVKHWEPLAEMAIDILLIPGMSLSSSFHPSANS